MQAINCLADRLDGRPAQALDVNTSESFVIQSFNHLPPGLLSQGFDLCVRKSAVIDSNITDVAIEFTGGVVGVRPIKFGSNRERPI